MPAPVRCPWALSGNELYVDYHDNEWGVPAWDDQTQFEFLILEGAQAGLSWSTILNKREGYRAGVRRLRSRAHRALRQARRRAADEGSGHRAQPAQDRVGHRQCQRVSRVPGQQATSPSTCGASSAASRSRIDLPQHEQVPATSPESDALSKDLKKRGFRFVGSTIIYAHMQATGMVNDHLTSCFRYKECKALGKATQRRAGS